MSEGIIIALITAIGSLLGGIIGQIITALATIRAAEIKEKAKQPSSSNDKESPSWGRTIGGAILGAIITVIILLLLGNFPVNTKGSPKTTTENSLQLGKLIFREDFDGNSNQWPIGSDKGDTFYIEGGEYHVIGVKNEYRGGGWLTPNKLPEQNFSNFYLEAKARFVEGSQQGDTYGILFRYSNNPGPYRFVIGNAKQVYSLYADKLILGQTYSPRIVKDGTNVIGILCKGSNITIYINGYKVDSVKSTYSSSGGIGFFYASNQHAAFDYIYIWELSQ